MITVPKPTSAINISMSMLTIVTITMNALSVMVQLIISKA